MNNNATYTLNRAVQGYCDVTVSFTEQEAKTLLLAAKCMNVTFEWLIEDAMNKLVNHFQSQIIVQDFMPPTPPTPTPQNPTGSIINNINNN